MRRSLPLTLAALAFAAQAAPAADDLFSEVTIESVFGAGKAKASAKTTTSEAPTTRITGAGQLGELLRDAGMKPERLDAKAIRVTVEHGVWTIPTTLRAAVERSQVEITMGLATPGKQSKLQAKQLLGLLSAPSGGGAYFAFDSQLGQIQLKQTLSARSITSDRLRRTLTEMAELAASREADWYEEPETSEKKVATTPKPAGLPGGTWIANLGPNEAFALRIAADGRFSLAHVRAGRTTKSTGRATRTGAQLRLAGGDGKALTGTISGESAAGFELTLTGGRKLEFKKA